MDKVYRYRCVFDERYSSIPYGDWVYVDYEKYCEIKSYIEKGNKYELQCLCVTHHKLPNEEIL
jgi:hypothetical protein